VGRLAVKLGIDRMKFDQCMKSGAVLDKINSDLMESKKRKVAGTPTYFIGNKAYPGGFQESSLKNAVEGAKKKMAKSN